MIIKPIRTDDDHAVALRRIDELWDSEDSNDQDELEILAILVSAYESHRWPIERSDPIDVLRYIMERHKLSPSDLIPIIGHRGRVYDILNHRRPLSLAMIRRLVAKFGISADLLISPQSKQ